MPSEKEVLASLQAAIIECDEDKTKAAAQAVLAAGVDPAKAIELAIGGAAEEVGKKFDSGEYFLPHLVMAADAMTAASDVLTAAIPVADRVAQKIVVIGTVEADLHSVGKNIVAMMMKSGGFDVYDLGVDVKSSAFVNAARDKGADIIALSSLMSTTMPYQREVIEDLAAAGVREKFKVIVGGGPVTKAWADEIGADGYGTDAVEALAVAKQLTGIAAAAPAR
jgi:corrinoid protein of di/trimethylamine methyltransferase